VISNFGIFLFQPCLFVPFSVEVLHLSSPLLLQVRLMHEFGYVLGNIDATIILQRPKLSPHKEKIRANLCQLLGADPSVVNIKVGPLS
jgi:2-C-methyl-D-erythritol 2,4-cyclodiphosphate synthase